MLTIEKLLEAIEICKNRSGRVNTIRWVSPKDIEALKVLKKPMLVKK